MIKIITYCFYILFFLTPLFWTSNTYELFEYNKMMLVYLVTIIITSLWVLRMLNERRVIFKSTPLDIPIILFLIANILSTMFSIDPHLSVWGYYSRSNGGLLSTLSYILLFFAFVSNLDKAQAVKSLKIGLISGFIVSLWAIPEHFGASPSCAILNVKSLVDQGTPIPQSILALVENSGGAIVNANCWIQDVQSRVFATFGQPNWLAAYLEMLIFPVIYLFLVSKELKTKALYLIFALAYYAAFTFTYSRGATLGLIGGLAVFLSLQFISLKKRSISIPQNLKILAILIISLLIINLFFDSALGRFKLFLQSNNQAATSSAGVSQIESGGTESGAIRLIVWQGAIDIFKHYPILGSGVETFALSYYQYRPASHNLVSEWDFLYNKAHNEYLNYLATTGIVGFVTYIFLIFSFIFWSLKTILKSDDQNQKLLTIAILAGFISNLIQNFFGFSVVMTALLFFLLPAVNFVVEDSVKEAKLNSRFKFLVKIPNIIFDRSLFSYIMMTAFLVLTLILVYKVDRFYRADILFAKGYKANEAGNPGKAYNALTQAVQLNSGEPLYQSELAYAGAAASSTLIDQDATEAAQLKTESVDLTQYLLNTYPKNVSIFRTAVRTYYYLATYDHSYTKTTLDTLEKTIELAPTDPKLTYNKAVILSEDGDIKDGITVLQHTIDLKPNYTDAIYALGLLYFKDNQKDKAIEQMKKILQIIPNQAEATQKLKDWVSTPSKTKK